jgi:hypothetical protein
VLNNTEVSETGHSTGNNVANDDKEKDEQSAVEKESMLKIASY